MHIDRHPIYNYMVVHVVFIMIITLSVFRFPLNSSSFVIEFEDEGQHSCSGSQPCFKTDQGGGCFKLHLLDNRDEHSSNSSHSDAIENREKQGMCFSVLCTCVDSYLLSPGISLQTV